MKQQRTSAWMAMAVVAGTVGVVGMVGCESGEKKVAGPQSTGDSVVDVKDRDLQANQRTAAIEDVWAQVKQDPSTLAAARETTKEILWKGSAPQKLRERAWALLLTDESEAGLADTRKFLKLRLPTESQWPVITAMCETVASKAKAGGVEGEKWRETAASLVRSYARKVPVPPDEDRPERDALLALYPGKDLSETVFNVFVKPVEFGGAPTRPDDFPEKSRQAAWDLLGRLDPTGQKRVALAAGVSGNEAVITDLNKCARELGVVPITGSELAWMRGLLSDKDKRNAAWWSATSAAVATLSAEQKSGLQMRHLEAVRFASVNRREWMSGGAAPKEQLLSELSSRLSGRRLWLKTEGLSDMEEKSRETLKDWQSMLVWGDLLTILVLDEAVREPGIAAELFKQAAEDQADNTTEYGGVLWSKDQGGANPSGLFAIRGYQPRTTQRANDRTFIAPEEMFTDSIRGLAHYHFHVQTPNNAGYAGPGRGDMEYADTHGRPCLVLTSVRQGVMNVDYYQRGSGVGGGGAGVVIDLGEINVGK